MILDSGERRTFESGAVRDIQVGKGRMDLVPLEVAGKYLMRTFLEHLAKFLKDGDTDHLYNALDCFCHEAYSAAYETMILEVSKHYEEGCKKYGENNWQKGLPVNCYIDSCARHYLKWLRGDKDENHHLAIVWNLMCCIWEVDYHEY